MPEKPKFNPNVPYQEATGSVPSAKKPAFDPNKKFEYASPELREGDTNIITPKYKTPRDLEVESSINLLKEKGGRNGSTVLDSEWDVLKDVLKDPRATEEQREKAILTIQGYDAKHDDNNTMYYNKLEDNGVYVPTALAYGEKPPKGYKVASVWGNQKEADDDSWYTDLGKSFGNGVMGAAQGAINLAQVGQTLVTGEESDYLNKLSNTAESLKFKKDSDLETPILNTEGITQWSDLLDKDRFDLSPKALWGAFNTAAESLVGFGGAVKGVSTIAKSGKGFAQGLQGVAKEFIDNNGVVQNAISLGDNATKATIFVGSFATQLGDNLDNAEAAGLKGRDKAAVASAITAPMAALDVFWGLDGKLMSQLFRNEKKELLKNVIKGVEKDAAGNITEQGFKQLAKQMTVGYTELAKRGTKEIVKDVLSEGGQEAAQDFSQKAGEQLWDKLTPDERGQFGTDAFNAKAFGDYINSFATGLVAGVPMAVGTQVLRNKHDEQSINAYERVKQGPEAVKALKADLTTALKNNDINQSEYEQAIFKIDSYDKYHNETKDVNLKPEDEKKAFELSFQIQGLKTEIPTNENEISKLDPIARAKVESKQKQAKELQSELNDIIRQGEIKGEPVIPKKEEERIQKEKEKEAKIEENNSKLSQEKEVEKPKTRQPDIEGLGKEKVISYPKLENKPYWKDDKRTYEEIDTEEFNNPSTDARTIHRVVRKEAYNKPNKKLFGNLTKRLYSYVNDKGDKMKGDVIEVTMEDGKKIRVASSKQEFKDENDKTVRWDDIFRRHFRSERTQGNEEGLPVGIRAVDLNNPFNEDKGEGYKPGKIALKVFDARTGKFLSWAKETKTGSAESLDKAGNELYTAEQKELLKTLEQQMYNETPEGGDVIERLTKPKPKPTPTEQATVELKEAKLEEKLAEEAADDAVTDEEIKIADAELEEKRALLKEASKQFAVKAKKYLGYLKYKKDFREVQSILEDKDLEEYNIEELNDLITKLFAFNDRAAKSVKEKAYLRLGHLVTVKQNEIHKKNEGFIEALGKTSDISPLQSKILHYSQFSEKNADMQALSLANGKAIIDKITEANSLKDTHAKLGLKVIQEENKRLGITGKAANRFSSDSSKYFEWMINEDGNYLTIDEAKAKGLSKAKLDYLDFHRETVSGYRESMSANDYENVKMGAIRVDKNFREAYKSEGLIPAFSYYLGGGATNLGRVRILHNGKVMSYSEIEKEIIAGVDKKNIKSIAKALYDLLVANIKARYQLKKGQNIDEKDNPLELKGDAEYSLNEKGQLVSKFDKPRAADRGYSKDFYKAMNQFIDESAHVKHISKIMPLVEAIEYLNKNGYMEEGYVPKKNVSKWINDWKALQIFKEPHVNDPIIDAAVKSLRKLVASTTMWFNIPANAINVFVGNYNNWRAENAETLARGNARLFGGKGSRKEVGIVNDYALAIIKKYNLVNQDFDSHPVIKAGSVFSKLATWGTQVGEYQIQGSLGLGLLSQEEYDSFEFTKDKYGNDVLTVKPNGKYTEDEIKSKMTQIKNRVTDIQGKYPDEDRRNIMRGEFGKALFQFKVWMPDWFKERFSARYTNAYGQEKEGSYTKMLRVGIKEMAADLKKGDIKKALTNPAFVQNLKGMATIGALLALKHAGDDDDEKKKGGLNWDSALSQVLFIFDLEQDKYMVSNPAAVLGKIKDMLNAFEALVGFEEDAWQKTKRIIPGGKAVTFVENQIK